MDRRTFVKQSIGATVMAGSYLSLGSFSSLLASPASPYDLVAIKGGEPGAMFDKGIEVLGGMSAFVKKGQKVVIKPNIGWDTPVDRAADTNPQLVARIIQHCLNAGAKEVYVLDHTCNEWQKCYRNSGIEAAAKNAGAKVAPANSENYYHEVTIPNGKNLKKAKEHELILSADVFIDVPVLKNHGGSKITGAMKNLMGCVWDREEWHRNDLHQCIADFATYRKPTLNVMDAYNVMKQNGPRGVSVSDVVLMRAQLISTDIVAMDAAGTKLWGMNPDDIRHICIAADAKLGRKDLDKLNIKRITV
jgi:uncharacterized protein (DUF362 family)